ncbi:hypothetical protein F503_05459 [Ophiostoma piceae UAMH 11346]|uniref:Uncharacterized protein n=1 Tax=Ophiostoma piceae (strain UAMH 11346) TaxID=1262450 RepID=S3CA15_OPHP1|nr:hypothetical protein F503_05459 [Ophiostoma piceae UAMH 11346]
MFASFYLTFLAFVVAMVSAQTSISGTTTSTLSMTQTITITRCNPTVTNCPANRHNTTTSTFYPASNTSTVAWPTTYHNKTTATHVASTGGFTKSTPIVISSATIPATSTAPAATSEVSTSGAQSLFVQSGLLLGGLAGAIALLA